MLQSVTILTDRPGDFPRKNPLGAAGAKAFIAFQEAGNPNKSARFSPWERNLFCRRRLRFIRENRRFAQFLLDFLEILKENSQKFDLIHLFYQKSHLCRFRRKHFRLFKKTPGNSRKRQKFLRAIFGKTSKLSEDCTKKRRFRFLTNPMLLHTIDTNR